MRIISTHPIIQEIQGATLVCLDEPDFIMTTPNVFPKYIINDDIEANKYGVAILNNTTLGIHHTQAIQEKIKRKTFLSSKTT